MRYRHELWRIHDDVVDDVIAGRITSRRAATVLASSLVSAIEYSDETTLLRGYVAVRLLDGKVDEASIKEQMLACARPSDRVRLMDHYRRATDASLTHLLHGSAMGWFVSAMLKLVAPWLRRLNLVSDPMREAKRTVNTAAEVEVHVPLSPQVVKGRRRREAIA
jgi:hypothetical protein